MRPLLVVVGGDKTQDSSTSWVITLPERCEEFFFICMWIYPVIYMRRYIAAAPSEGKLEIQERRI
jgi:hypothetical protein